MLTFLLQIIFIGFFFTGFQFFAISGYGVTILDFSLLAFYLYIAKKIFWDGIELRYSLNIFHYILFGIILSILLSSFTPFFYGEPEMVFQYLKSLLHFVELFLFAFILLYYPIELKIWKKIIQTWLILGLLINIFGVYQIIARALDLPLAWIEYNNVSFLAKNADDGVKTFNQLSLHFGDFFRATSIFSEPSALGTFNTYMLAFLVVPLINKKDHFFKSKVFIYFLIIWSSIGILVAFSMTGFMGVLLVFLGMLVIQKKQQVIRYSIIIFSFISIITIFDLVFSEYVGVSIVDLFRQRVEGIFHFATHGGSEDKQVFGESFGGRLSTFSKSVDVWKQYPVQGIGLGLTSHNKIHKDLEYSDFTFSAVLAEEGIIGAIVLLSLFILLFTFSLKHIKNKRIVNQFNDEEQSVFSLLYYIIIVQFIINFISGNNFSSQNFWLPVGMVLSLFNYSMVKRNINVRSLRIVKLPLKYVLSKIEIK